MTSPDSSMDESLQEFLDREGIKLDQIGTAKEETVNMEDILKASVGITAPRTLSWPHIPHIRNGIFLASLNQSLTKPDRDGTRIRNPGIA